MKARIEGICSRGGNAFRDFQLPQAALALKQGVGRLIRSEEDFGVVVDLRSAPAQPSYGPMFLGALPPART